MYYSPQTLAPPPPYPALPGQLPYPTVEKGEAGPPGYPGSELPDYNGQPAPSAPALPPGFSLYPDLPPPAYSESVWGVAEVRGREDDENTTGDWQFVPRYAHYNTNY